MAEMRSFQLEFMGTWELSLLLGLCFPFPQYQSWNHGKLTDKHLKSYSVEMLKSLQITDRHLRATSLKCWNHGKSTEKHLNETEQSYTQLDYRW